MTSTAKANPSTSKRPLGHLVRKTRCSERLYSKNKIVDDERKEEIIADIKERDDHFICHQSMIKGFKTQCRGDYDRQPNSRAPRMAKIMGIFHFVDE